MHQGCVARPPVPPIGLLLSNCRGHGCCRPCPQLPIPGPGPTNAPASPLPSSLVTADSSRRQTLAGYSPAKSPLARAVPAAATPRFRSDGKEAPHSPSSAPSDNATSWRIPSTRIPHPAAGTSPAAEPAAGTSPAATPTAPPTAHGQPAAAWATLDLEITAEEADWIVCPAPLATSTPGGGHPLLPPPHAPLASQAARSAAA